MAMLRRRALAISRAVCSSTDISSVYRSCQKRPEPQRPLEAQIAYSRPAPGRSPMKRSCMAAALTAGALLLGDVPLLGWDVDVHYMLTFWIATQAGFSRRDADDVARGDQSFDDSSHHDAIRT